MHASFLFASLLTFFYLYLTWQVVKRRHAYKIAYNEPHPDLQRAIRAHGNFQEYAPLFLLLLTIEEAFFHHTALCYIIGAFFLLGRMLHAYSLLVAEPKALAANAPMKTVFRFRFFGMIGTYFMLAALAVTLFVQYITTL